MKSKLKVVVLLCFLITVLCYIIKQNGSTENINRNGSKVFEVIILCATNQAVLKASNASSIFVADKLEKFILNFVKYCKGQRINLNVITNDQEIETFNEVIKEALKNSNEITYEFKSLNRAQEMFEDNISISKKYTGSDDCYSKSGDVTFHFRFLYPRIFSYERAVALDIDTELRVPFIELYQQFEKMNRKQIIGIAYNQNPYYREAFKQYRMQNPGTLIGDYPPGYAGLSAGVMLFNLQKMRESKEFNYHLTENGFKSLIYKYNMTAGVGDQDFYTLLGAEYPFLFYILDCSFNRLMSTYLFSHPLFYKYYKCDQEIKIYHGNGQSAIPSEYIGP